MAFNSQPGPAPTRLAVLGCGTLARQVLLPLLSRMSGAEVTVVADPDVAARDASVRFAPNARSLADWRDALASDADGVVVALPTAMHAEAAIAALEAGRHLYLEKPIGVTVEEGNRVVESWRAALKSRPPTTTCAGFNYRFNPLIRELRRRLRAGAVGGLKEVRTTFSMRAVPGGWRRPDAPGGGVLLDLGSHHIDLMRYVTGDEIVAVSAEAASGAGGEEVTLTMQLSTGAQVRSTFATGVSDEDRIEVAGQGGTLGVDRYRGWTVMEHRAAPQSRVARLSRLAREAPSAATYGLLKQRSPWHEPSFALSLRDFIAACSGATASGATLLDGLRSLEVVEAASRSLAERRTVALESNLEPEPAHVG